MYEIINHKKAFHKDTQCFRVTEGEYKGFVFQYDTISLPDDMSDPDKEYELQFNYITVDKPEGMVLKEDTLSVILGSILTDILTKAIKETDGTTNTKISTD